MNENKNEYKMILRIILIVVLVIITLSTVGVVISKYTNHEIEEEVTIPSEPNESDRVKTLTFDLSSNHAASNKQVKELLEAYFINFSLDEHGIILSQTTNENRVYESTYQVVPKEQMDRQYVGKLDVIEKLVITSFELFTITPEDIATFQRVMVGDDELGNEEQDQGLPSPDANPSPETPQIPEPTPTPNPEEIPTPEPMPGYDEEEILLLKEASYKIVNDKVLLEFTSTKDVSLKAFNKGNIIIRYYNKSGEVIKSQNKMTKDYLTNTETHEVFGRGNLIQAGTYQATINDLSVSDIYKIEVELIDNKGKSNKVHLEILEDKSNEVISLIDGVRVELVDSALQVQFTTLKDLSLKIKDKENVVINYYDDTAKIIKSSNKMTVDYLQNIETNELIGSGDFVPAGMYKTQVNDLTIEDIAVVEVIATDRAGNSDTKRIRVYTESLPLVTDVNFEKTDSELTIYLTTNQDISLKLFEKGNITINYLGESGEIVKSRNKWQMDYLKSVDNQYYGFGKVVPLGTYSVTLDNMDIDLISKVEIIVKDGLGNEGTKVLNIK